MALDHPAPLLLKPPHTGPPPTVNSCLLTPTKDINCPFNTSPYTRQHWALLCILKAPVFYSSQVEEAARQTSRARLKAKIMTTSSWSSNLQHLLPLDIMDQCCDRLIALTYHCMKEHRRDQFITGWLPLSSQVGYPSWPAVCTWLRMFVPTLPCKVDCAMKIVFFYFNDFTSAYNSLYLWECQTVQDSDSNYAGKALINGLW